MPSGSGWPDLALDGLAADRADVHLPEGAGRLKGTATPGTARRLPRIFSIFVPSGCAGTCMATIAITFPASTLQTSHGVLAHVRYQCLARQSQKKNPHHSRLLPRALFLSMFELCGSNTDTVRFSSTSTKVSSNGPDENRKLVSCWGSASWILMFSKIEQKSHVDHKVVTLFFSLSVRVRTFFITRDGCVLWMFATVVTTCLFFLKFLPFTPPKSANVPSRNGHFVPSVGNKEEGPTRLVPGHRCGSFSFVDALGGTVETMVGTDCQRRTQTY